MQDWVAVVVTCYSGVHTLQIEMYDRDACVKAMEASDNLRTLSVSSRIRMCINRATGEVIWPRQE